MVHHTTLVQRCRDTEGHKQNAERLALVVKGETFTVVPVGHLDPDYRRQPKTQHFCCLCQRDIKTPPSETGYVHYVDGGNAILAVEDEARFSELQDPGDMYSFPIGPDCARKLPKGFVHPPYSSSETKLSGSKTSSPGRE